MGVAVVVPYSLGFKLLFIANRCTLSLKMPQLFREAAWDVQHRLTRHLSPLRVVWFAVCISTFSVVLLPRFIPRASAQPVLIQLERSPAEEDASTDQERIAAPPSWKFSVRSFDGTSLATVSEQHPEQLATALVLASSLTADDRPIVETALKSLRRLGSAERPFRVVILDENGLATHMDGVSTTEIRAALAEPPTAVTGEGRILDQESPISPVETMPDGLDDLLPYTRVGEWAREQAGNWSSVIVIGRLPQVEFNLATQTATYLADRFRRSRLRLYYLPIDGYVSAVIQTAYRATEGGLVEDPPTFRLPDPDENEFLELNWSVARPRRGFHPYSAEVIDENLGISWTFPSISVAAGWAIPVPEVLREFEESLARVSFRVANQDRLGNLTRGADNRPLDEDLSSLLGVNPGDERLLLTAADYYEAEQRWAEASVVLSSLTPLRPDDTAVFSRLGMTYVRQENWNLAEEAFLGARGISPADSSIAEALGRVYAKLGDFDKARTYFKVRLDDAPENQEIWLLHAEAAQHAGNLAVAAASFERAIALPDVPFAVRTRLAELYIDLSQSERALEVANESLRLLASNRRTVEIYAEMFERLGDANKAIKLWRKTYEIDPKFELGYFAVTRLLSDQADHPWLWPRPSKGCRWRRRAGCWRRTRTRSSNSSVHRAHARS